MTDWDAYARSQRPHPAGYEAEPVQQERIERIAARCVGRVLDVGAADGYPASLIRAAGHHVDVVDISRVRIERACTKYGLVGYLADAAHLPFPNNSYDTVVLGEIVEHLDNPGAAIAEAFRVARERVIVSVPLNGWEDPTHQWRISLDHHIDVNEANPTKREQVTLTFQHGRCWPSGYTRVDPTWAKQFGGE